VFLFALMSFVMLFVATTLDMFVASAANAVVEVGNDVLAVVI